eukprot:3341566-Pleurochrysis_carterae.AAC.1
MQAVHACIKEPEARGILGGAGKRPAARRASRPTRRRRREESDVMNKVRGAEKRGAERSTARGPCGSTHAAAKANGKGGWGQRRSLRERGA